MVSGAILMLGATIQVGTQSKHKHNNNSKYYYSAAVVNAQQLMQPILRHAFAYYHSVMPLFNLMGQMLLGHILTALSCFTMQFALIDGILVTFFVLIFTFSI